MSAMASEITGVSFVWPSVCSGADDIAMTSWWVRWRLKSPASRLFPNPFVQAQIKVLCHWPVTSEFPAQRASNAENVSIWWRHHAKLFLANDITRQILRNLVVTDVDCFPLWHDRWLMALSSVRRCCRCGKCLYDLQSRYNECTYPGSILHGLHCQMFNHERWIRGSSRGLWRLCPTISVLQTSSNRVWPKRVENMSFAPFTTHPGCPSRSCMTRRIKCEATPNRFGDISHGLWRLCTSISVLNQSSYRTWSKQFEHTNFNLVITSTGTPRGSCMVCSVKC